MDLSLSVSFPSAFSSPTYDGLSRDNLEMGNKSNVRGMIRHVGRALVRV